MCTKENEQPNKDYITIYTFLDLIKEKLPEGHKDDIYNGISIGLKTNYIRYLNGLETSDPCIKYHYYIFCKDIKNRQQKPSGKDIKVQHFKYTKHKIWFWVCGYKVRMPFYCLSHATKSSLLKYIREHELLSEVYCDPQTCKERDVFFFDDSDIKWHIATY